MSYKYYSSERPVMPGSFPKPQGNTVLNIENFNDRSYVGKIGREAWGFIEYEKPISPVLLDDFELVAASDDEDKDKICKLLCKVLQLTRGASDLKSLDFNPDAEIVTAVFEGGSRTINVACDSGTAMIRDIMNHLEC